MTPVAVREGEGPVILGFPHAGTFLPDDVRGRLNETGLRLTDTDWHVDRLYEGLLPSATTVRATFHRYVIDANRPPSGESLYPGRATTDLVPLTDFDGAAIWRATPTAEDVAVRRDAFHAPYHAALAAQMARVKARWGVAILHDCHSIRSRVPRLFDGVLPDLNIGTVDGATCAPEIAEAACAEADVSGFSWVSNGRFRGGWCTRAYGRPAEGLHAIQMELAQVTHLATEAPPFAYDAEKAARLRPVLARILARLDAFGRNR